MSEKVLVVIADEQIRVYHTDGVETAVIVDGEDVQLPDDWTELPRLVIHSLPITVRGDELFAEETPLGHILPLHTGPSVHELTKPVLMKTPYCHDCDDNHPLDIGCDGLPRDDVHGSEAFEAGGCPTCSAPYGEKHRGGCADQNLLVSGGDIVR